MTFEDLQRLVFSCTYKPGWMILCRKDPLDERPYIQVEVEEHTEAALCPFTGGRMSWRSGKRYLSYHMCRQEVVGACLASIKDAEMHEIHEWFKYRGVSIYNPHLDPDALVEVAKYKRNLNVRQNAMTMEELPCRSVNQF